MTIENAYIHREKSIVAAWSWERAMGQCFSLEWYRVVMGGNTNCTVKALLEPLNCTLKNGLNENPHIICILAQYKEVRVRSIWVQIELNEIPY